MSRILFIRGGAIGDFILTLPILEAIHHQNPGADIDILGYPAIAELAVGRRLAVAARDVGGAEWAPLFSTESNFAPGEREYVSGFEHVYCVWPDGEGAIAASLKRAGAKQMTQVDPMPSSQVQEHVIEYMTRQCRAAGLDIAHAEPHLYPSERDQWWAERYMRVTGAGHQPLLGIHPGSGSSLKNWPVECFAEVAVDWMRRHKGYVLVVAGPADDAPLKALRQRLDEERTFVFRNESLPRVAAVLERCAAFVGNDSGISHMAAAVRTPTVAVFGTTDSRVWRPHASCVTVVESADRSTGLANVGIAKVIGAIDHVLGGQS